MRVNSYYQRKNFKPTVTLCYEFLKHTLELLPNENNPVGLTLADAALGMPALGKNRRHAWCVPISTLRYHMKTNS